MKAQHAHHATAGQRLSRNFRGRRGRITAIAAGGAACAITGALMGGFAAGTAVVPGAVQLASDNASLAPLPTTTFPGVPASTSGGAFSLSGSFSGSGGSVHGSGSAGGVTVSGGGSLTSSGSGGAPSLPTAPSLPGASTAPSLPGASTIPSLPGGSTGTGGSSSGQCVTIPGVPGSTAFPVSVSGGLSIASSSGGGSGSGSGNGVQACFS